MRSPRKAIAGSLRKAAAMDAQTSPNGSTGRRSGSGGNGRGKSGSRVPIDGFPAPEAIQITPRAVKAGDTWFRTLAIVGWPREVSAGWPQPPLSGEGAADLAPYLQPIPHDAAA